MNHTDHDELSDLLETVESWNTKFTAIRDDRGDRTLYTHTFRIRGIYYLFTEQYLPETGRLIEAVQEETEEAAKRNAEDEALCRTIIEKYGKTVGPQ